MMEYKVQLGSVEFDDEAGIFHGNVVNTRDVITFQGKSVAELKKALHDLIEDYLAFRAGRGEEPDKPFSGQFVTRISPELHRRASEAAARAGKSLNTRVAEQLQSVVATTGKVERRNRVEQKPRTPAGPSSGRRAAKKKSQN